MKASDGLTAGVAILVFVACLFVLQGVLIRVNAVSSPLSSYSYTTYYVYECGPMLGTRPCAFVYYVTIAVAGLFSFVGALFVAFSIYRLIEPNIFRALPPPPPRAVCPKCGTANLPNSQYCSECATKL